MKSTLVKRLFRALSERSDENIDKVCRAIVADSRKVKHNKLADELEKIIDSKKDYQNILTFKTLKLKPPIDFKSKQKNSFVSIISHNELDYFMALNSKVEERFMQIEKEYAARERLLSYGLRARKRVLLYGPPGCGKTLGARRLAWTTGLDLVKVNFDSMVSSLFGESASNLRSIFDYCQENPSVLLLDECDFIARSRENKKDIGEVHRIVNTLLQLLEDYDLPGLLVATTNLCDQLDHALFRRFDDVLFIPFPEKKEIIKLLKNSTLGLKRSSDLCWEEYVDKMHGLSAANIISISQNACKDAVLKGKNVLSNENLGKAFSEGVVLGQGPEEHLLKP